MHLLLIDDEPLICDTIAMSFPKDKVTTCLTAEAGVAAFLREKPDVVLVLAPSSVPDRYVVPAFHWFSNAL